MPVMELYRPLPEQESSTEGIVGTAAALRVSKSGRRQIRRIIANKDMKQNIAFFFQEGILW